MTFPSATVPRGSAAASSVPTRSVSVSRYSRQACLVLVAAFTLSAVYTVWSTVTGLVTDGFTATEPGVWVFYAVAFGLSLLVLTDKAVVWWALAVVLPLLLAVGVVVYPSQFTPERQTPFGWFENDVYLGLLMLALYLTVQRLRRRTLAP